jgi:hypothetical protein
MLGGNKMTLYVLMEELKINGPIASSFIRLKQK